MREASRRARVVSAKMSDRDPSHNHVPFNDLLIQYVEERPSLWNVSCREHKDPRKITEAWQEIARLLQTTVKVASDRWKNLRDTYKKCLRKLAGTTDDESSVRWIHFQQLQFLNSTVHFTRVTRRGQGRQNKSILSDGETQVHTDNDAASNEPSVDSPRAPDKDSLQTGESAAPIVSASQESSVGAIARPLTKRTLPYRSSALSKRMHYACRRPDEPSPATDLIEETMRQIEKLDSRLESSLKEPEESDPDRQFLLSLLPELRLTPPELRQTLKINLLYITGKFSRGTIPAGCLQLDL